MTSFPAESLLPAPVKPWTKTPCVLSAPLSKIAGCNVWLKLENLQPSGSFKSRGIGNLMRNAATKRASTARAVAGDGGGGGGKMHFYSSSGGNAGLACACAAITLNSPCTIVVPETTKPMMVAKLRGLRATVVQTGRSWSEADAHLRTEFLAADPAGVYVPPFDHPHIWAGAATLVDELVEELVEEGVDVRAVVCAVGGGGLLNGVVQGIEKHALVGAWKGASPVVVAVETEGADSLNASVRAGEHVTLPGITSIATSLGAVRVCNQTWEYARRSLGGKTLVNGANGHNGHSNGHNGHSNGHNGHSNGHNRHSDEANTDDHPEVVSVVVSDADAARAVVRFADHARMLVEVSCGASLATVYGTGEGDEALGLGSLRSKVGGQMSDEQWKNANVVVVVCGGSAVSLDVIEEYRETYGV